MCCGINIVCNHLVAGVDTAGDEDTRFTAVEVGSAEEVLRAAVSVAVAPCCVEALLAIFESLERILTYIVRFAGLAVEVKQELGAGVGELLCHTVVTGVSEVVGIGVADNLCCAVGHVDGSAVGCAEYTLCLAVEVPVVCGDVDFVALEVNHVAAAVNPPHQCTVELVDLNDIVVGRRVGVAGVVECVVAHFYENLHLAVAVEVGDGSVVGLILR